MATNLFWQDDATKLTTRRLSWAISFKARVLFGGRSSPSSAHLSCHDSYTLETDVFHTLITDGYLERVGIARIDDEAGSSDLLEQ